MEVNISNPPTLATEGANLCWNCSAAVAAGDHFCPQCSKVQAAEAVDHFTFFALPRKLHLDMSALEKDFYRLSRKLHPDVYARATADEQRWSLEKSSQLNDAYRTLKEPIARTQYLLGLEGVKIEEQSSSTNAVAKAGGKTETVPPELLEEVFELNMQLQELSQSPDQEVAAELALSQKKFEARLQAQSDELQRLWSEWDRVIETPGTLQAAREAARDNMVRLLNERSYIRNLVRDVTAALEESGK